MTLFWSTITDYILLFFVFSVCGWCMEVALKYRQYHRFINRGFFIGPLCPIYGTGAVLITLVVGGISHFESSYGMTFVISFFVCGAVEYFASYFMEKKYHARWWDYSQKPMNLNGRIWIGNLILFGIGGTIIIKILDPFFFVTFAKMPWVVRCILSGLLCAIFVADYITSYFIMKLVKVSVENSEADDTEAVSKEVRMLLSNKSVLHQRFADAYPDVIYKTERISKKLEEMRFESERLRDEVEMMRNEFTAKITAEKENLTAGFETAGAVKNTIIEKQEALIIELEKTNPDMQKITELKEELQKQKEVLKQKQKYLKRGPQKMMPES